ncbi:MAG: GGDEF domain-containing protein [Polyangiaceae bacterium]
MTDRDSERTRVTLNNEARSPAARPGDACLVVIYGSELGRRVQLGMAAFDIGRSPRNDLFIDQESVSRHHARITFDGSNYWVQDLQSTNGTFVNDESVREQKLRDGDQLRVGRSILKFMTGENVEVHYHEEIYRLMTVDGLTDIYNRRYFDGAIEREFNRAVRYARPLSLVLFDIDHFKRVNDTYGHLVGDGLLRQVAAAVRPRLRREDIFSRTGGEEFGILLPEVGIDGARATAEKVRRIVEATRVKVDSEQSVSCTVSLGVEAVGGAVDSADALYKSADERCYEAKGSGRNRVAG